MGSQFVDFTGDGQVDYFTATFDGTPWVAAGTDGGFAEPEHIGDRSGARVMLDQYWNYDTNKWVNTGGDNRHCTSAVAFDWDADGDFDLLLGDYNHGELFLQINEGAPGEAAFTGESVEVKAGGESLGLHHGMTAPRLVDWDGDGLTDIVAGSFGSATRTEVAGGVYWYRNVGKRGAPEFAAAVTLIAPTHTDAHHAERPNIGLYADPVDYDGDGDLDLVVGGYAVWTPKAPKLGAADRVRVKELESELASVSASAAEFQRKVEDEASDFDDEAKLAHRRRAYQTAEYKALSSARQAVFKELRKLKPMGQRRETGVWVYLRETGPGSGR